MKCNYFAAILSMCMIPFAGCAGPSSENDDDAVVDRSSSELLTGATELNIARGAGASDFEMLDSIEGWREVQPGVWENETGDEKQQLVGGAAGHKWLAEQAGEQLKALRATLGDGADEALAERVSQAQRLSDLAMNVELSERADATTPAPARCSISLYTGPLSTVSNPPMRGAASLARIACTGGSVTFTVRSVACCAGACSSAAQTVTVGSTTRIVGSARTGTGAGSAGVSATPPGITRTNSSFTCG